MIREIPEIATTTSAIIRPRPSISNLALRLLHGATLEPRVSSYGKLADAMPAAREARVGRMMRPIHRWVWGDLDRRVRKLLVFGEVETDGGRDILRAAEVTPDPLLRRLYLEHALDELRHGHMFRERGAAIMRTRPFRSKVLFGGNPLPG